MSNYNLDTLNNEAIDAAVRGEWLKAIELNLELTKKYPTAAEIFNRLAKAYIETTELDKARKAYRSALKIDPYNHIAKKNLEKISTIDVKDLRKGAGNAIAPNFFLEEPGKTKMAQVEDLAMGKVVSILKIGDKLTPELTTQTVILINNQGKRIGKLDSETADVVSRAMRKGSKFDFIVRSIDLTSEQIKPLIFIKESFHSPKLNAPVFPTKIDNTLIEPSTDPSAGSEMEEAETSEMTTAEEEKRKDEMMAETLAHEDEGSPSSNHTQDDSNIDQIIDQTHENSQPKFIEEETDIATDLPEMAEGPEFNGESFGDSDKSSHDQDTKSD